MRNNSNFKKVGNFQDSIRMTQTLDKQRTDTVI